MRKFGREKKIGELDNYGGRREWLEDFMKKKRNFKLRRKKNEL